MNKPLNRIIAIAREKRDGKHITPEDVSDALKAYRFSTQEARRDLLEIIGKQTNYGVEDHSLCAFIAWQGKT